MFEPYNATDFGDLSPEADAALREGMQSLSTPSSAIPMDQRVISALSSGVDFDPWYVQIRRRAGWMLPPALAAFCVFAAINLVTAYPWGRATELPLTPFRPDRTVTYTLKPMPYQLTPPEARNLTESEVATVEREATLDSSLRWFRPGTKQNIPLRRSAKKATLAPHPQMARPAGGR